MTSPPPGWYPDPQITSTERFWNGNRWVGTTRPLMAPLVPSGSRELASPEMRRALLNQALMAKATRGFRVESQHDFQAVVVKPANVNHVVHLIVTLLTCGLWLLVWLIIAMSAKTTRMIMYVDEFGQVSETWAMPG
jgi:hypothetical protein